MNDNIVLLLLGGIIGFASSILTLFATYYIEGLRLKRQWAREDHLQHRELQRTIEDMALQEAFRQPEEPAQAEAAPSDEPLSPIAAEVAPTPVINQPDTERHPILADLDLDTLKKILDEETRKPAAEQKTVLVRRLQKAIEWFEKSEAENTASREEALRVKVN